MSLALWLADIGLKSTTILVLAGLLTLGLSRRSAALRHLVWGLALGAALVLPLVSPAAPRWSPPIALPMPGAGRPGAAQQATPSANPAGQPSAPASPSPSSAVRQATATPSRSPDVVSPERVRWASWGAGAWRVVAARWARWLVPLWAAGSGLILAALGLSLLRTGRLRRLGRPVRHEVQTLVERLSIRLGLQRRVTALELDANVMPMTFGALRPVILLPASAAEWSADRLQDVLLHELAHVQRYDCLTQIVARCACALYWLNPLVWVAARRLGAERELACDDLVLASGSRASDYATHLLEIARGLHAGRLTGVGSIAMARPSQLPARLLAVLDGSRAREALTGRLAMRGSVAALALIVPLAGARTWETRVLPAPSAPPAFPAAPSPGAGDRRAVALDQPAPAQGTACAWDSRDLASSASHHADDDQFTIRIKVGACSLRVDGEGEVTFSDSDDDVTGISHGGFFHIEERGGDHDRRVEIEAAPGGLERKWLVDGKERPYDAEARAWLAQRLLVVFRRTGLDAKNRAERILRRGGVNAVLQEVAQIPSDYGARQYYQVLLTQSTLDQPTLLRIVRQAGQDIGSDFELAELLIAVAEKQPLEESVRLAYVEAVRSIGSDFERHRALRPVLTRQGISREMAAAMLATAKGIGSDFELASLLIEISQAYAVDATLAPAFFDCLASVGSDFEHHRVLSAVARQAKGDQAVLERALDAAVRIRSDFELASFLIEVADAYPANQALPASFLADAGHIRGDFEHARVLKAVIARKPLTEANLLAVLESAETIQSDFELAEVVIAAARALPPTERTRPAFLKAADHISSPEERGRVLAAIFPGGRPA
jgi:beta-lactamase regulating signal transducer with metallopeptidase domain